MSESKKPIQIQIVSSAKSLPDSWQAYVESNSNATIFHSAHWQQVIERSYPYKFNGIQAIDSTARTVGVLPAWLVASPLTGKRLVSSPFSYICDPLADDAETESLLVDEAKKLRESTGAAYYEMKCLHQVESGEKHFAKNMQFETYLLDLSPSEEQIWAGTHKGIIQRGVNKAQKEGVTIVRAEYKSALKDFHHLNLLTCRKHGIPAQPFSFHETVWNELVQRGLADFFFANHQGKPIASVVIFYSNETATYMYGASDETYLNLRPNHLLLWEAIKLAKSKGMTTFDLGRVSDDNPGLKEFKQRWGAQTVPLHYYYYPEKKGVGAVNRKSLKFKFVTFMFSKMPLFVTARLTWLYKHLA